MRRLLAAALLVAALTGAVDPIPLFTGPQDVSNLFSYLNQLIVYLNAHVLPNIPSPPNAVDIQNFGADPTGTSDSSAQITLAMQASYSQGITITCASGTFKVAAPVYFYPTVTFISSQGCLFKQSGGGFAVFQASDAPGNTYPKAAVGHVTLQNLLIDQQNLAGVGIMLDSVVGSRILSNKIIGIPIFGGGATTWTYNNNLHPAGATMYSAGMIMKGTGNLGSANPQSNDIAFNVIGSFSGYAEPGSCTSMGTYGLVLTTDAGQTTGISNFNSIHDNIISCSDWNIFHQYGNNNTYERNNVSESGHQGIHVGNNSASARGVYNNTFRNIYSENTSVTAPGGAVFYLDGTNVHANVIKELPSQITIGANAVFIDNTHGSEWTEYDTVGDAQNVNSDRTVDCVNQFGINQVHTSGTGIAITLPANAEIGEHCRFTSIDASLATHAATITANTGQTIATPSGLSTTYVWNTGPNSIDLIFNPGASGGTGVWVPYSSSLP